MIFELMKENCEIGNRFKVFRETINKTPEEVEKETGYPADYVLLMEEGKAGAYLGFIEYFYSYYNLNLTWLVKGKGHMILTTV